MKTTVARLSRIAIIATISLLLAAVAFRAGPVSASPTCSPAVGTGLTTYMTAASHQVIAWTNINATGCDVGIYVGPGTYDVTINHVSVTGANDHGIFAQDARHIIVKNSFVNANGMAPHTCASPTSPPPCIRENKAIEFAGVTESLILHNVVTNNSADGGIGIADDGPTSVGGDPAALNDSATTGHPGANDWVIGNIIVDNNNGCGLVIAGYDAGVGVRNDWAIDNTVIGVAPSGAPNSGPYGGPGSYYGQIVVAGDGPFTNVTNVHVVHNKVIGSLLPGIVVHANVFGDKITNTIIRGNTLADNGYYPPFFGPPGDTNAPLSDTVSDGISVVAEVGIQPPNMPNPIITHTEIISNTILGDNNGVWLCGTDNTGIYNTNGNPTNPIVQCPAGGS